MCVAKSIVCSLLMTGLLVVAQPAAPQSSNSATASLPRYVSFTGVLKNQDGKPAAGTVDIRFLIYEEEAGGEPLWAENQRVTPDAEGHFTVTLGANTKDGLPKEFFTATKARWLAIEPEGLPMPDRVLLLSVPYAFKAGDAETLGGLPASAFLRSGSAGLMGPAGAPTPASPIANGPTGGGTTNFVPLWTPDGSTLGNSVLFQSGTGATAKIGLNTTTPQASLDIAGTVNVGGLLRLPFQAPATTASGSPSQPFVMQASSFSSTTQGPVTAKFQLMAVPKGNNTSSPTAALALSYGTTTLSPTGFSIGSNGQITFARGQTFPGTLTGVTAGTGLSSAGTTGAPTLSLNTTYTDGRYAQLSANNTYSGIQLINNAVGIGIAPAYPLHVNGAMRSETGLSLGGNAQLSVDAPFNPGAHFLVDGNGDVGINNPFPTDALDVTGNIVATGSVTATGGGTFSGPVSASGFSVNGVPVMTVPAQMYLTGYLPGPLAAFAEYRPIFAIPSKNIVITRLTSAGINTCPNQGSLLFSISTTPGGTRFSLSLSSTSTSDSGPLSIPVAAGSQLFGVVNTPTCGSFSTPPSDIPLSIEYVMQ